jgi:hypothetical protein
VEEAEPLEADVDVVLGELVGVDLLDGHLGELLDAVRMQNYQAAHIPPPGTSKSRAVW